MLNHVVIQGRIVHTPSIKYTESGTAVANLSVAVSRNYLGQDGQRETDFFDVVAWRKTAEFICNNFAKGQQIILVGSLQTRAYTDKEGNKRKVTEIVANEAHFCGSKRDTTEEEYDPAGFAKADAGDDDEPF